MFCAGELHSVRPRSLHAGSEMLSYPVDVVMMHCRCGKEVVRSS